MTNKKSISLQTLVDLYNNGKSASEIAEVVGRTLSNVTRRLKKYGINYNRDSSKVRHSRTGRKNVNIDFFKAIDSPCKAYFLGIMCSDGSVSRNVFYLKLKDSDVVYKFKEALNCDNDVRVRILPYESYILSVYCQEMCKDLCALGCVPNKTRSLRFPQIPEYLYSHFVRGYIDGNGCIRVGATHGKDFLDIVTASYEFALELKEVLLNHASFVGISKENKYDVWHVRCGGNQVKTLLDWVYANNKGYYMQRKYFKYQLISSH